MVNGINLYLANTLEYFLVYLFVSLFVLVGQSTILEGGNTEVKGNYENFS